MTRRHRRHSTQLKLQLARAYLNGEGSFKAIAKQHDISHALLMAWVDKYRRGEITEEIEESENLAEYKARIAALECKVGQLVMELDGFKKREVILSIGVRPLIDSDDPDISVCEGCAAMNLAVSTYYASSKSNNRSTKAQQEATTISLINNVRLEWPAYGYRRVAAELSRRGIIINHKRVARIMREHPLKFSTKAKKPKPKRTGELGAAFQFVAKGFNPDGPNQLWVTDVTYIRLRPGFIYLADMVK